MKKMYIKSHPPQHGAGYWIYRGYASAWEWLGYEVKYFDNLEEIKDDNYHIMTTDGTVSTDNLKILEKAKRVYLYVQPTKFPDPWGKHPNFQSLCPPAVREIINTLGNVYQWTYGDVTDFHNGWNNPTTIKLAFDNINYKNKIDDKYFFDICFIGGLANNGFNEKQQIMIKHFVAFKDASERTGLKCGFFINQNLSHEQEEKILSTSALSLNIHDAYQRELGLDTNERTFKSLGLCGAMISDDIKQLKDTFPDVYTSNDPRKMVENVMEFLSLSKEEIIEHKIKNIGNIQKNHTYINRAMAMEKL
jgi:hypothetical protein